MIYIGQQEGDFNADFNADFSIGGSTTIDIPKTYPFTEE